MQGRAGPEKYWSTSKKIFLALLFHKNSENIEKTVRRFDPGSISALRVKLPVELHDVFVYYWPLKHIYFFRAPNTCLMGFYSGPALDVIDMLHHIKCNSDNYHYNGSKLKDLYTNQSPKYRSNKVFSFHIKQITLIFQVSTIDFPPTKA